MVGFNLFSPLEQNTPSECMNSHSEENTLDAHTYSGFGPLFPDYGDVQPLVNLDPPFTEPWTVADDGNGERMK